MDEFEAGEADFAALFFEIGGRLIERIAEFDQHVQTSRDKNHSRAASCRLAPVHRKQLTADSL
jgi:hypothetical protein